MNQDLCGYFGRQLRVSLKDKEIKIEKTEEEIKKKLK